MSSNAAIAVAGQIGKLIWDPVKKTYDYIQNYKDNVDIVKRDAEWLKKYKDDINVRWEQITQEEEITDVARQWLDEVSELLEKNAKLKKIRNYRSYSHGMCRGHNNLYTRYKWSKTAEQMHGKIQELLKDVPHKDSISRPLSVRIAKQRINEYMSYKSESRQRILEDIVNKLLDDQVHVVGLFGNAFVGKTKIAKDIRKDQRVKDAFGTRVAMVEVSQTPDKKDIQDKMVEAINEDLKTIDNVNLRAMLLNLHIHYYQQDKILIILDHIWGKLNLQSLGITPAKNCKVLVISRIKSVCEAMGAKEEDIRELNPLSIEEAKYLFWTHVYHDKEKMIDQITSGEYLSIGDKLLSKYCQGLPLAVVTLAKVLRDQSLLQWQSFTNELEIKGKHEVFYSIWDKSFKLLDNNKAKKMFFLLTCLFPQESSITVEELMRYAMGIDLIQCVDNLTQAITLANTWAHELISSSLLEVDDENCKGGDVISVILPRLVREHAMSLLAKEGENFRVEPIPRWHTKETCQNYTAISLMFGCDHSRLSELDLDKLQMLILYDSQPRDQFADTFFRGMTNLKVLVLKGMKLQPHLPNSIGQLLKHLRSLRLESCELGTINWTNNGLVNLVVLSLRESKLEELPVDVIRSCHELRLLDLSKCRIKKGIPTDVLGRLSHLEGLYAYDCFEDWAIENGDTNIATISRSDSCKYYATASISELNKLKYLNVLEMKVQHPHQLPVQGDQFAKNLDRFYICVGTDYAKLAPGPVKGMHRILHFQFIEVSSISRYRCVMELLKKTEMLMLLKVKKLQHFIDTNSMDWFRMQNLQILEITKCSELQYFSHTPFKAPNLRDFKVTSCANLNFFFERDAGYVIEFPNVKVMVLHDLQSLETMSADSDYTTTNNELQGKGHPNQAFFNTKILFPKLEELELYNLGQIVKLWDLRCKTRDYISSFENLNTIVIWSCAKLEVLASFAIAVALKHLKELEIVDCPKMKEVITNEDETKHEELHQQLFPSLESVTLEQCPKLQFFITGIQSHQVLELPSLQTLVIRECLEIQALSSIILTTPSLNDLRMVSCAIDPMGRGSIKYPKLKVMELSKLQNLESVLSASNCTTSNSDLQGKGHQYQAFFHPKFRFPELDKLDLETVGEIIKLWDVKCKKKDYISSFRNLKTVKILSCAKLKGLASFAIAAALEQLKELTIVDCPKMKSAITKEKSESELRHQQLFPSLETVSLARCPALRFFITGIQYPQVLELPSLQNLEINECPKMQAFSSTILMAPKLRDYAKLNQHKPST